MDGWSAEKLFLGAFIWHTDPSTVKNGRGREGGRIWIQKTTNVCRSNMFSPWRVFFYNNIGSCPSTIIYIEQALPLRAQSRLAKYQTLNKNNLQTSTCRKVPASEVQFTVNSAQFISLRNKKKTHGIWITIGVKRKSVKCLCCTKAFSVWAREINVYSKSPLNNVSPNNTLF